MTTDTDDDTLTEDEAQVIAGALLFVVECQAEVNGMLTDTLEELARLVNTMAKVGLVQNAKIELLSQQLVQTQAKLDYLGQTTLPGWTGQAPEPPQRRDV